jgi:hypothetical protein
VLRWLFRLVLTLLAARLLLVATRRARASKRTVPGAQPFDPRTGADREKTPRPEGWTSPPIADADYEDLPRSRS